MECKITKKGLMSVRWNSKKEKEDVFVAKHPIIHINHTCEIEDGVRLIDIMRIVAKDKLLAQFISFYSDINHIDEFHKELEIKYDIKETECDYLEIYRTGDPYDGELYSWVDFHGVKAKEKCKHCNKKKWPDHGHYVSYSYTPIYQYAKMPIKLNERYIIRDFTADKILLDIKQKFTFIEILHAIYYDISFHGGPKDRDNFLKEIKSRSDSIDMKNLKDMP